MAATRGSRFFAFFTVLIASITLAVLFAASAAHADPITAQAGDDQNTGLVAAQADGSLALIATQADGGATITEPANNATKETGKNVTVKAKASYTRPDGSGLLSFPANYIYVKVSKDGETVLYASKKNERVSALLGIAQEFSFTPEDEGEYLIEAHNDWTYVDGKHVDLAEEDFVADVSITIIVQKDISKADTQIDGLDGLVYTGRALEPAPTVTVDGKALNPVTDYDVSYDNNVNAGENTASVTVTGKGFYKGSKTQAFSIAGADISQATVTGVVDRNYGSYASRQDPKVVLGGTLLVKDTDYTVTCENYENAGTATCVVTGMGNYAGEVRTNYIVNKVSLYDLGSPSIKEKTYTGQPITQDLSLWYGRTLIEGQDYTATYKNNVNPGTATVTITGINNFKDTITRTFSIFEPSPSAGATAVVTAPNDQTQFNVGSTITVKAKAGLFESRVTWVGGSGPPVETAVNLMYVRVLRRNAATGETETVKYEYQEYNKDSSWEVSTDFTADVAGEYLIQVRRQGIRAYLDTGKIIFLEESDFTPQHSITVYVGVDAPQAKTSITNAQVTGVTDKEYTGNSITQTPTVKLNGKTLKNGTDYYITYRNATTAATTNNVDVATIEMTIHGTGSYTDAISKRFNITPKQLKASMVTLSPTSFLYNGELQKPQLTVKDGPSTLGEPGDFSFVNEGGTEPGEYQVTITAREGGNYTGAVTKTYKIEKHSISNAFVTVDPTSYIYDGQAKEPTVTATIDGVVLPPEVYDVTYSNNVSIGTAQVKLTAKADSYYKGSATGMFKILGAPIDGAVVTGISDATYAGKAIQQAELKVMLGDTELVSGTDYTVTYSNNVNAGRASVGIEGKGNYSGKLTRSFNIKPLVATFAWSFDEAPYEAGKRLVPTASITNLASGDAGDVSIAGYEEIRIAESDSVTEVTLADKPNQIRVSGLEGAKASNYAISASEPTTNHEWHIVKGTNAVSFAIDGWTYGDAPASPRDLVVTEGADKVQFVYSITADGTYASDVPSAAGTYWVKAEVPETTHYLQTISEPVSFKIAKRNLKITAANATIDYGDEFAPADAAYEGLIDADKNGDGTPKEGVATSALVLSCNYAVGKNAGTYSISCSGFKANNYKVTFLPGTLTVDPLEVSFVWTGSEFTYNGQEQRPTCAIEGARAGDDVKPGTFALWTVSNGSELTTTTASVNAASYRIEVSKLAGAKAANYAIDSRTPGTSSATFEIKPAVNEGTVSLANWTYGSKPKTPSIASEGAMFGRDKVTFSYGTSEDGPFAASVPTLAGDYFVKATIAGTSNYSAWEDTCAFRINKAMLTATYAGESVIAGAEPKMTVEVTGFVNGETTKTAAGYVAPTAPRPASLVLGEAYTVTPEGGQADNYDFTYVPGTLRITAADMTALLDALSTAHKAQSGVVVSADGYDVKAGATFVSANAMSAFNKAIDDAQAVVDDMLSAQSTVDNATRTLNSAIRTFNNAKKIALFAIASVTANNVTYKGARWAPKPTLTVTDVNGRKLTASNYTATYVYNVGYGKGQATNGAYVGLAKVTVKGKGKFTGSKTASFKVTTVADGTTAGAALTEKTVTAIQKLKSGPAAVAQANSKTMETYAMPRTKQMRVNWKAVSGATNYLVGFKRSTDKEWSYVVSGGKTTHTFNNMNEGNLMEFRVAVYDGKKFARGEWTQINCRFYREMVSLKATVGTGKISLAWGKVAGATGYQVLLATKKDLSDAVTIDVNGGSTLKTTITKMGKNKLKSGKTYYLKMRAVKTSKNINGKENKYIGIHSLIRTCKIK